MSHIYSFNKKIIPEVLKEMIRLDRTLGPRLVNLEYNPENNDYIEIITDEVLDQSTEQILIDIIQSYSSAHMMVIRYNVAHDIVVPRMNRGRSLTAEISAMNQVAGKDMALLFDIYKPENELSMLNMIDSGAFEMAFIETYKMWKDGEITPNPRWSQSELDEIMRRLEWEIGDDMAAQLKAGV